MILEWSRRRALVTFLTLSLLGHLSCRRAAEAEPANELPFGSLDVPRDGETVGRMVTVAGWALDDSGIATVHLYVNGEYRMEAPLHVRRPDVSKAFPKYEPHDDLHGWRVELDLGPEPGPHTIRAQAIDDRGATRNIGEVRVTIVSR